MQWLQRDDGRAAETFHGASEEKAEGSEGGTERGKACGCKGRRVKRNSAAMSEMISLLFFSNFYTDSGRTSGKIVNYFVEKVVDFKLELAYTNPKLEKSN